MNTDKIKERAFALGTLFLFLFDFNSSSFIWRQGRQICWPHWESCREWPIPQGFPASYNYTILFAIVFSIIVLGLYGVIKKNERIYISSIWVLACFKLFFNFFWYFSGTHNFEIFHLAPTFAFLINRRDRILGAQIIWAICYFLAASVKINESWIIGTYFSSLNLGLPLLPDISIPFFTQFTILFEIFFSWGLLTKKYRNLSVILWVGFHIYSVTMVGFFYPTRCIIFLFLLFLNDSKIEVSLKKLNHSTLFLYFGLIMMQLLPLAYTDENINRSMRFEGYRFNMFPNNYQCVSHIVQYKGDQKTESTVQLNSARTRCSPHAQLEKNKILCESAKLDKLSWTLVQSVNGNPFIEIVSVEDSCHLKYSLFGKNEWIKTDSDKVIGYPKKNAIEDSPKVTGGRVESIIAPIETIQLSPVQSFIEKYYLGFYIFYYLLWITVLMFVAYQGFFKKTKMKDANSL